MTREEAVKIANKFWGGSAREALDVLEELRLIKFEVKKMTPVELIMKHQDSRDFFIALDDYGYKIVPK